MVDRALIVLLLVMNLGVALWWSLRPEPAPAPGPVLPAGAVVLEPLPNGTARPAAAAAASGAGGADPATPQAPPPEQADATCHRLGPFVNAAAAAAAAERLAPRVLASRQVREWARTSGNWRVFLPAAGGLEQARQAAARIAEAGFEDYHVVAEGAAAGTVALGLYRTRERAESHAATLREAGFAVRVEPTSGGDAQYWLAVAAGPGFDAAAAQAQAGAPELVADDCAGLLPAPGGAAG